MFISIFVNFLLCIIQILGSNLKVRLGYIHYRSLVTAGLQLLTNNFSGYWFQERFGHSTKTESCIISIPHDFPGLK